MNMKHSMKRATLFTVAAALVAVGVGFFGLQQASAAHRGDWQQKRAAIQFWRTLNGVVDEEQKAVLRAFREDSVDIRAERRDFIAAQREILTAFELSPEQWEALSAVVDTHGDAVIDAVASCLQRIDAGLW